MTGNDRPGRACAAQSEDDMVNKVRVTIAGAPYAIATTDNENYTKCPLYKRLQRDIEKYIARTIWNMKRSGAIRDDSTWTVLRNMRQGSEIK